MLRTLGGRNIGKCRLRAHQHPLLPPLPNQRPHKLPPTYLQRDSFNERVLKMACCIHRFLISGSDLGINARFLPVYALLRASILDFKARLANRCSVLAAAVKNAPPAVAVAATRSASDSILRCRKGERFRLQDAVADAGGGRMHEGGIALSKKPPEWYLSPL